MALPTFIAAPLLSSAASAALGGGAATASPRVVVVVAPRALRGTARTRGRGGAARWVASASTENPPPPPAGGYYASGAGAGAGLSAPAPADGGSASSAPPRTSWFQMLVVSAIAVVIGACGGAVGSLIGAGGGIVITPLLSVILAVSQLRAHGTSLCIVAVTSLVGALRYHAAGHAALPAAAMLASAAIFTAPLGARAAAKAGAKNLKAYFGAFLVFAAALLPAMPYIVSKVPGLVLSVAAQRIVLVTVGALSGFLSGLLGIGGGTFMVPALVLLAALPQKLAQGTALVAMVVPSSLGALTHLSQRSAAPVLIPGLAVGAILGSRRGSDLALSLPEPALRIVSACILCAVGLRYIWQANRSAVPEKPNGSTGSKS